MTLGANTYNIGLSHPFAGCAKTLVKYNGKNAYADPKAFSVNYPMDDMNLCCQKTHMVVYDAAFNKLPTVTIILGEELLSFTNKK